MVVDSLLRSPPCHTWPWLLRAIISSVGPFIALNPDHNLQNRHYYYSHLKSRTTWRLTKIGANTDFKHWHKVFRNADLSSFANGTLSSVLPSSFYSWYCSDSFGLWRPPGENQGEESTWANSPQTGFKCPLVLTLLCMPSADVGLMAKGGVCKFVLKVGGLQSGLISKLLLRNGPDQYCILSDSLNPAGKAITAGRLLHLLERSILRQRGALFLPGSKMFRMLYMIA